VKSWNQTQSLTRGNEVLPVRCGRRKELFLRISSIDVVMLRQFVGGRLSMVKLTQVVRSLLFLKRDEPKQVWWGMYMMVVSPNRNWLRIEVVMEHACEVYLRSGLALGFFQLSFATFANLTWCGHCSTTRTDFCFARRTSSPHQTLPTRTSTQSRTYNVIAGRSSPSGQ
jgi:hypothetical protein